jgi:hypothetical protein
MLTPKSLIFGRFVVARAEQQVHQSRPHTVVVARIELEEELSVLAGTSRIAGSA